VTYAPRYRVSPATLAAAELWRVHDTGWGAVIVTFVQRRGEVPVFRETLSVVMDRELRAVALTGYFLRCQATKLPQLSQGTALASPCSTRREVGGPARLRDRRHERRLEPRDGPLLRGPAMVRRCCSRWRSAGAGLRSRSRR